MKPIDYYPKKKKKTLSQEERAFHEAYQILLFTYPKIIKQRKKHLKPPWAFSYTFGANWNPGNEHALDGNHVGIKIRALEEG